MGSKTQEHLPGFTGVRKFGYEFNVVDPYFGHVEQHTVTEPDSGVWTTLYDYAGRIVQSNRPDSTAVRNTYEGSRLLNTAEGTTGPPFKSLARTIYTYNADGQRESRWGPVAEKQYLASKHVPGTADYLFHYTWSPEDRPLSVQGPNDKTSYTWNEGVLTLEEIAGVTNKAYGYYDDYPRIKAITTGTASPYRTQTFQWDRGLWLAQEQAEGAGLRRVNVFSNRDAYGTPLDIDSTVNGAPEVAYSLTTDARGRVSTSDVTYRGSSFLQTHRFYYKNG
jgi:hypothetical protein